MQSVALVIGNQNYDCKEYRNLKYVKNDVQKVFKIFKDDENDIFSDAYDLMDTEEEKLQEKIKNILSDSELELFLFYYSGHADMLDEKLYLIMKKYSTF